MGRPLSERELKRTSRELSGHLKDKDRARWKRKASGQALPKGRPRERGPADDAPDDRADVEAEE